MSVVLNKFMNSLLITKSSQCWINPSGGPMPTRALLTLSPLPFRSLPLLFPFPPPFASLTLGVGPIKYS